MPSSTKTRKSTEKSTGISTGKSIGKSTGKSTGTKVVSQNDIINKKVPEIIKQVKELANSESKSLIHPYVCIPSEDKKKYDCDVLDKTKLNELNNTDNNFVWTENMQLKGGKKKAKKTNKKAKNAKKTKKCWTLW